MSKEIFALDIGTRKVMGIIAKKTENSLEILDAQAIEHSARPMFDGQIHSIEEVSRTVRTIKERLESRLNKKLKQVGVAVAGRNLLTCKSRATTEFESEQEVAVDMVRNLELEAVDRIVSGSEMDLSQFYCVGYSPVYYELDGHRISTLVGHSAKSIATEVIVTFLPRVVLDSMFAVLKKAGLEATNITLEPISAINAIIPPEMRKLNIVLVDIGAGTSDLALTREGVIFAYGMVSEAGDEVTELISEILLVDFSTAERIKRGLGERDKIEYKDIWGRCRFADVQVLRKSIIPAVKRLADSIAKAGLDLNGGVPSAVVAVGGGSMTSGLIEELSASFNLSADKVGIRLPEAIKGLNDRTQKLTGPEAVTPIGIALMTAHSLGLRFINIEINNKKLRILDFQQKKDIMGALTLSGAINKKRLYPRPGLAMTAEVNGELKIIKGTLGVPAKILLNGHTVVSLSEKIEDGDRLVFEEAQDGKDASCLVSDLVRASPIRVLFNQESLGILPKITMNEEAVSLDIHICDRANIKIMDPKISDIFELKGVKPESLSQRQILVNINGSPKVLTQRNFTLRLNGKAADLDTQVNEGDAIEFYFETPTFYRIKDVIQVPRETGVMHINVDGNDIEVRFETVQIFMNGQQVSPEEFLIDKADIRVFYLTKRQVLLSEIFRYIDFDPQRAVGKSFKILVNDQPAGFTTPLEEGSRVRILLEERDR